MPSRSYRIGRSLTGLGLFAAKQIKRGAYIATYRGRRIPTEESDRREARGARYMFELNKRWVIDGSPRWNVARYINHSCRPNAKPVGRKGGIVIVALTTKTVPVVFGMGGDPVKAGMVASFKQPGGNVTGFTLWTNETESKRLGLLRELVPGVPLIGILVNPRFRPTVQELEDLELAAKGVNQQLFVGRANNDAELDAALASFEQQRVGAFLVTAAPFFDTRRDRIISFAAQNRLPAIYQFREYAVGGGLISYGPNIAESYKNAGIYVGRILKGEKPADLPVLQPSKFDFVINLKTAKALGLTVPPTLLIEAGEVIE